jgi:hypothetical protein
MNTEFALCDIQIYVQGYYKTFQALPVGPGDS